MKSMLLMFLGIIAMSVPSQSKVTKQPYGKAADGTPVELYTLQDDKITVRIMTYGGIIVSLKAPDRNGKQADIVLFRPRLTSTSRREQAIYGRDHRPIRQPNCRRYLRAGRQDLSCPQKRWRQYLHGTSGFNKKVWAGKEIKDGGTDLMSAKTARRDSRHTYVDGSLHAERE